MSMLTDQISGLRLMARLVRDYDYSEISRMLREAADTIESLMDRLQAVQGVGDETNYDKLFGTPERAAVTLVRTSDERAVCKLPTWTASSNDYDAWLEWLKGDA